MACGIIAEMGVMLCGREKTGVFRKEDVEKMILHLRQSVLGWII